MARPWKRGTAAARAANTTVPAAGELGVETDTGRVVVADGVTAWASLPVLARLVEVPGLIAAVLAAMPDVVTAAATIALALGGIGVVSTPPESGSVIVFTDSAGRVLLSISPDGTVQFSKAFTAPAGTITMSMLSADIQAGIPSALPVESGMLSGTVDAAGRIIAGTRMDGSLFAKGIPASPAAVNANYIITVEADANGSSQLFSTSRSTGAKVQLTTVGQNTSPIIDSSDVVIFRSDQGDPVARRAQLCIPAAGGASYPLLSEATSFYAVGDSLTAGTGSTVSGSGYPAVLAKLLGKAVANDGSGGQTSTQIAARQGGTLANVTFSGNSIAATTSAQTVTVSLDLLYGAAGAYSRTGTIGGVHGTLTAPSGSDRTAALSAYTFTRDTAGSAVSLTGATAFVPDVIANYGNIIQGFWAGRNDFDTISPSGLVANVQSMVNAMRAYQKRFWVLSIPPQSGETIGSGATRTKLDAANAALAAAFPNNWIDGAGFLRTDAAFTMAGITKTSQDITDITNGITPTSFRSDAVHLNDYGYLVIGTLVRQFLAQKGWA